MFRIIVVCAIVFCSGVSYSTIAPESVVGIWTFDEGDGEIVKDVSGNGNDGVFAGEPKWVEGKFGTALDFTSLGDVVHIAGFNDVAPVKEATITLWTKLGDTRDCDIFGFDVSVADWMTVHLPWGNKVWWMHGQQRFEAGELPKDSLGNWEFWAFIRSSNENYMRVVRNTKEFAFKDDVPTRVNDVFLNGDDPWNIGGRSGSSYTGVIDEVGVFNTVLNDNELSAIMKNGLTQTAFPVSPFPVSPSGKAAAVWGEVKKEMQ